MSAFTKLSVLALRSLAGRAQQAGSSEILRSLAKEAQRARTAARPPEVAAPSRKRDLALVRVTRWGFFFGVVVTVAGIFGFLTVDSSAEWLAWARIAAGVALGCEGLVLLLDWRGTRKLLVAHFRARHGAPGGSLWNSIFWRSAGAGLGAVGLLWIAVGVLSMALGAAELVPGG